MKIAYIANSIIPGMSANSVHVMKMCEALKKQGVDITLVLPKYRSSKINQDEFSYYGIQRQFEILRVGFKKEPYGIWNLLFSIIAVLKLRGRKYDIIYTRNPIAARVLSMSNLKFIFEYHSIEYSKWYSEKKIFKAKNLKKFVVISTALKEYYRETYNIEENKIIVLPDGVNLDEYAQISSKILLNKKLKIAYVGGLYPGRGIDVIIEMARRDPENEYLIVGGREEQVKFWEDKLEDKLDNLTFVGQIPNAEVPNILIKQDILLMPYQKKVGINGRGDIAKWISPMKMFEYMASGRVIVSSNLPVLQEVLTHKRNAYLVEPDNVSQWLDTIKNISENREEAAVIAMQAKEDVKAFSWEIRAAQIKKVCML